MAPPEFREETSKKAVRLGAVCDSENWLRRGSMQALFAALHHFSGPMAPRQKTAVLVAPPKFREETSKKAVSTSAICV